MATQKQENRLFNLTPNKSQQIQQSTFFQKGFVSSNNFPQKIAPNYQFTYESMPKVNCHYHVDQYITMFCRCQTCQMPLCPQCVKIHSQEHQAYNTYGDFDTLENCLTEVYQSVAGNCNRFVDEMGQLNKVTALNEGINYYMDKVKQARQQCYQVIDNFFNTLEAELAQEIEGNRGFMTNQSQNFSKYLQQRWKTLMSLLEKLNTDRCVKTLVKYYTSNLHQENEEYYHESNQFMKQFNKCVPEIIIDQSALYELNIDLAKFVSLKKVPVMKQASRAYPQYPPNEPMQPMYNQFIQTQQHQTLMPLTNTEPPIEPPKQYPVKQGSFKQEQSRPVQQDNTQIHPYLLTPPKTSNFYQ
ncbi:unnamed protein product [Paramecium primaurelia]|uniref:B box-type domain-containing protein n=1 Tax=Paramecium primaurelia TaxID=5886 RepID=A0A8S1P6B8_PARPR|nr:unnamed protein product [Paramecium primaurelia]